MLSHPALGAPLLHACIAVFALLSTLPLARAEVSMEGIAQARQDLLGEPYYPAWTYLSARHAGPVSVDAYAGLDWAAGLEQSSDADIYTLAFSGQGAAGRWAAGRQIGLASLRRQTYDGLSLALPLGGGFELASWGGWARHQDLDDLSEGSGVARASIEWRHPRAIAVLGAQFEGGPDDPAMLRQDLQARVQAGPRQAPGWLSARVVLAEDPSEAGPAVPEWAEGAAGIRLWSPIGAGVYLRHRETADPESLFGDAILQDLAGGVVEEWGGNLSLQGRRWSSVDARYARTFYDDGASTGHSADLSYLPPRTDAPFSLLPAWSYRSGPGGVYHAFSARGTMRIGERADLGVKVALIPFHRDQEPWTFLGVGGLDARRRLHRNLLLTGGADLVAGDGEPVDARLLVSILVESP